MLGVVAGHGPVAGNSTVRKLPLLWFTPAKWTLRTLGPLPRRLLAAETTEEQPLFQLCILTLVLWTGRTGIVFRILAAKESGGTEGVPEGGRISQPSCTLKQRHRESTQPQGRFKEDDPVDASLQVTPGWVLAR